MFALVLAVAIVFLPLAQETVYEAGPGITLPAVVKEVKPEYTPRAMREKAEGTVWLSAVVQTTGEPTDIRVTKPLHSELDTMAVEALEQWRFRPGMREGKAVPVRITVEMSFTLKK